MKAPKKAVRRSGTTAGPGRFRIIAGRWRGRRFPVPAVPGVRPTPDRVRETLFNWLGPLIPGARCLDLYAGSGALGLEALSRGAGEVVFVDQSAAACAAIDAALGTLDIVFLDPPFRQDRVETLLLQLGGGG